MLAVIHRAPGSTLETQWWLERGEQRSAESVPTLSTPVHRYIRTNLIDHPHLVCLPLEGRGVGAPRVSVVATPTAARPP